MGDRMADGLAAIAGSSDPSIIRKIKEEIDDDVTSSLQEMKRVIEQRYHERLRS
jgi:MinD-like ATPase involved in chromosome partitioning or flagellar assembly